MKILSIFNRYRQYGGEETVMERIGDLLRKNSGSDSYIYSTDQLLGSTWGSKIQAPLKSLNNRDVVRDLEKMQKEHSYDVWLIHNVFPALSPAVFSTAFTLGVPVMFMVHNYRTGCINGSMLRDNQHCELCITKSPFQGIRHRCWHQSYLLSAYNTFFQHQVKKTGFFDKTDAFIAISHSQVKWLERMGFPKEKIHVIPHFVTIPDEIELPRRDGNVLFMGRLSREKGVNLLLEAWLRLSPAGRKLIIVGTGPEEQLLKQFVLQHKMENVEFKGFVPESLHPDLWKDTAFYIMPSICEETAAMTILEGWSYGRPALAYNIGAAADYLQDLDAGWLAEINGHPKLEQTLGDALSTTEERLHQMSRHVRQKAISQYNSTIWLNSFTTLYKQITHLS